MEELLSRARSFPPPHVDTLSNEEYNGLIEEHVKSITASVNLADIDLEGNVVTLLNNLDPAIHSAAYGIIVDAALAKHKAKVGPLIACHILQFAALFDTIQARYIGGQLKRILEVVLTLTIFNSAIAVDAVTNALLRIDPDGTFLSSTRINLTKLAYQTSNIDAVYPLVSKIAIYFPGAPYAQPHFLCSPILATPEYITLRSGMTEKLTSKDIMEYEMICGSIFCAKRNWKAARGAFSRCATQPMRDNVSRIGVEAYKKWILTSLIVQGILGAPNTPNPGTQLMRKSYLSLSKPYLDLAEAFRKTFSDLRSEFESNTTTWAQDNNTGLVNEVMQYFVKWRVGSLRSVYTKASLAEIYDSLLPSMGSLAPEIPELEIILTEMISEGMLSAVLVEESSATPAHVVFVEPATTKTPEELNERVVSAMGHITQLKSSIRDINALLELHPEYLNAQLQEAKRNRPSHEDKPPKTFEKAVVDEDLMDDVPTE